MKRKSTVWAIGLLFSMTLQSCAMLGLSEPSEEEKYANDPVAQAALALRPRNRAPAMIGADVHSPRDTDSDTSSPVAATQPRQLTLGLTMAAVRRLWGEPQNIEVAGDTSSGNERWTYLNGLSRQWGTSLYRIVHFQDGLVTGWESH